MNRGFIALTLVLIVSSMLIVFSSYKYLNIGYFFDSTVRKEYRLNSYYNALSCADQAILNLTKDYFYRLNAAVKIKYFNCYIDSVIDNGGYVEIRTHGEVGGATVRILTKVSLYSSGVDKI